MAGLNETAKWEREVYQIEEDDPVLGGVEGVTNKPLKHLANRTLYLKQVLEAAGQKLMPKKLTATTRNTADSTGHTHEIDLASTTTKGLVQLTNDTGLDSEVLALTAKAGKAIAQAVAQLQINTNNALNNKINKADISDSVSSTSQTTVASSKAAKTAYDKGVEAKSAADAAQQTANAKQSPATTLAGYGITDFIVKREPKTVNARDLLVDGIYAFSTGGINLPANVAFKVLNLGGGNVAWRHQLAIKAYSSEMYLSAQESHGSNEWLPWKRIDGADWSEVRNKPDIHIKGDVVVLTGEIAHGGTIPLPSGFSESQCNFFVSMQNNNKDRRKYDVDEFRAIMHNQTICKLAGRVVTATYEYNGSIFPGIANYIVIGVK